MTTLIGQPDKMIDLDDGPIVEPPESEAYRRGYADGWADAMSAHLKAENADLKEMLRVGNERMKTRKD